MYEQLARRVLAAPARLGRTRLVAVDGPSGAGKSVFAGHLADALAALTGQRPPVVRTDDLLDGWADQLTFWPRLETRVLAPLRRGEPGAYQRYDWHRGAFDPRPVPVPVAPVLIVEGVTAARAVIRPELSLAVFVTADPALRLARALRRDGADILPELRRWHRVEEEHHRADGTRAAADIVIDTTGAETGAEAAAPGEAGIDEAAAAESGGDGAGAASGPANPGAFWRWQAGRNGPMG